MMYYCIVNHLRSCWPISVESRVRKWNLQIFSRKEKGWWLIGCIFVLQWHKKVICSLRLPLLNFSKISEKLRIIYCEERFRQRLHIKMHRFSTFWCDWRITQGPSSHQPCSFLVKHVPRENRKYDIYHASMPQET